MNETLIQRLRDGCLYSQFAPCPVDTESTDDLMREAADELEAYAYLIKRLREGVTAGRDNNATMREAADRIERLQRPYLPTLSKEEFMEEVRREVARRPAGSMSPLVIGTDAAFCDAGIGEDEMKELTAIEARGVPAGRMPPLEIGSEMG